MTAIRASLHKIGAVRIDAAPHVGERLCDLGTDILRRNVDEAHRDACDHMLQRGAPLQRLGARPQPQAKISQDTTRSSDVP